MEAEWTLNDEKRQEKLANNLTILWFTIIVVIVVVVIIVIVDRCGKEGLMSESASAEGKEVPSGIASAGGGGGRRPAGCHRAPVAPRPSLAPAVATRKFPARAQGRKRRSQSRRAAEGHDLESPRSAWPERAEVFRPHRRSAHSLASLTPTAVGVARSGGRGVGGTSLASDHGGGGDEESAGVIGSKRRTRNVRGGRFAMASAGASGARRGDLASCPWADLKRAEAAAFSWPRY
ncbi:unnamed protein product [Lampetra planeri]